MDRDSVALRIGDESEEAVVAALFGRFDDGAAFERSFTPPVQLCRSHSERGTGRPFADS